LQLANLPVMPAFRLKQTWIPITIVLSSLVAVLAETLPECHERAGLLNLFAKLESGKTVLIAYLVDSITAQEGWRPKTLKWIQSRPAPPWKVRIPKGGLS
jgi:hypothetical protein